jgi:hypothetical protein
MSRLSRCSKPVILPAEHRPSAAGSVMPQEAWKAFEKMVPIVGIELTTYRLQGGCSTN